MKPVREIISREIIDDLWGAGYTILPRNRHPDPFFVPADMVPQGRAYQWWHLIHDKFHFERPKDAVPSGWAPVPASRHDGYFMPAGFVGDIEVNGLGLFEKSKYEVDAYHAEQKAAAQKLVDDWQDKYGREFVGEVTVATQTKLGELDSVTRIALNTPAFETTEIEPTKTIEDTTAIPRDMHGYVFQIFAERDRLSEIAANAMDDNTRPPEVGGILDEFKARVGLEPETPRWPTLNAIILPIAIKNVRKRINEEAASAKAS